MPQPQTVIATWLLGVIEQFRRFGIDPAQLGHDGLATPVSLAPTRQLQLVQVRRVWQRAMQLADDPLLGLKVGAALPLQSLNVVALVVMHSASLRQALANTVRYQQLISNSGRFGLRQDESALWLFYRITPSPVSMHPAQVDSVFAGYLGFLSRCVPGGQRPERLDLPGTNAALAGQYQAHFECPVRLGATEPRVSFGAAALDVPWPAADPQLLRLALERADSMLQAQGRSESLVDHVLATVARQGLVRASCADVAATLELSTRTLQRRLADSRTSFRQIVEAARMDEALRLLADERLRLSAVSERLGYAEPSAFSHSVRSHFGKSPRALRAELINAREPVHEVIP